MKSAPTRVSLLLLCVVFLLCLYRAATQSFTIDESFTFLHYVDTDWRTVFGDFSANNHVLFSLVSRVFRYKFGRSEIILRVPTLLGCIAYLLASFRICRVAFGDRWMQTLALALLTLNPLVLDFLVAARGYGMGLALFWWSLYLVWRGRFLSAGLLAGLSIATNLIYLVPLAALGAAALIVYARQRRHWELIYSYGVPAVVIPFMILVIPLSKSAGQFYYGVPALTATVESLVSESAPYAPAYVAAVIVPGVFLGAMAVGAWLLSRTVASPETTLLAIVLGSMGVSVVTWIAMHQLLHFVYPLNRTALYMLPLAGLALALGAANAPWRLLAVPLTLLALFVTAGYIKSVRIGYFNEWRSEAAMNKLARRLGSEAAPLGKTREVTVGGTWLLEYTARYYGKRYRLPWLKVLNPAEREKIRPDYYFLTSEEAAKIDELHLQVVEKDAFSGTVLARSL